jgi:hypothetical protein
MYSMCSINVTSKIKIGQRWRTIGQWFIQSLHDANPKLFFCPRIGLLESPFSRQIWAKLYFTIRTSGYVSGSLTLGGH